jgi:signal transduction histidine kinase
MLHSWVVRPLLELAYLVLGLVLGVLTFTVAVVGLSLSIGLMPAFLLGVPVLVATVHVVHGFAVMERRRAEVLLDTTVPARPLRQYADPNGLVRSLRRAGSAEFWKETAYAVLLLPMGLVSGTIAITLYAAAATGLLLPLYAWRLTGGGAISWLSWGNGLETVAGFLAGLLALLVAQVSTRALVLAHVAVARALLAPTRSDALRARVTELKETRARVVDAADAERRRIERDLHDGTQQQLVAIAMNLGRAKLKLDEDPEGARELVTQAHRDAKDSIVELRNVIRGVHPAVLEDRGLDAALSALAARSPVPVRLDVHVPVRPTRTVEAVAYFVVSEALTNVAKHSRATHAEVQVATVGDRLLVTVSDDGVGGAEGRLDSGLTGLQERVHAVDGAFELLSPPGRGTTLRVAVPCAS